MCGLAQIGVQDDSKPAEHPDDFDAAVYDAIEDDIAIYGEAAKICLSSGRLLPISGNRASTSHFWATESRKRSADDGLSRAI